MKEVAIRARPTAAPPTVIATAQRGSVSRRIRVPSLLTSSRLNRRGVRITPYRLSGMTDALRPAGTSAHGAGVMRQWSSKSTPSSTAPSSMKAERPPRPSGRRRRLNVPPSGSVTLPSPFAICLRRVRWAAEKTCAQLETEGIIWVPAPPVSGVLACDRKVCQLRIPHARNALYLLGLLTVRARAPYHRGHSGARHGRVLPDQAPSSLRLHHRQRHEDEGASPGRGHHRPRDGQSGPAHAQAHRRQAGR